MTYQLFIRLGQFGSAFFHQFFEVKTMSADGVQHIIEGKSEFSDLISGSGKKTRLSVTGSDLHHNL